MYGGEYRVTEEQIRFYEENGFVQLHDVLTAEEVATLRAALDIAIAERDRLKANWGPREDEGYTKVFLQMVNVWERYAAIEEYVLSSRVGGIARQLTRELGLPQPRAARAIVEKRATLAARPGLRRPSTATRVPGFVLAGDWTASDYPSTLESPGALTVS